MCRCNELSDQFGQTVLQTSNSAASYPGQMNDIFTDVMSKVNTAIVNAGNEAANKAGITPQPVNTTTGTNESFFKKYGLYLAAGAVGLYLFMKK